MAQMHLQNRPNGVLISAACYQFALSGSDDRDIQRSISTRFSAIGNYMLTENQQHLTNAGLVNLGKSDLDTINRIAKLNDKRIAIMNALCIEFGLTVHNEPSAPPFRLGARFRTNDQLLPEHMWVNDRAYSYDTMPEQTIFRDNDGNGTRPPLERDIPVAQIVTIGLSELTVYQQIMAFEPWV
ncbi:MAG: hypothetical protein GY714_15045 [Desulfobacterales bacterium]|nr:hypothetical protein [Desulfobacterales bacterium]